MVILTKKSLWIIKYDFIAMRIIEKERHELNKFDTIQTGVLTYPASSIVPWVDDFVFVCILCPSSGMENCHLHNNVYTFPLKTLLSKLEGLTNGVGSLFTGELFKKNNGSEAETENNSRPKRRTLKTIIQCIPSQVDLQVFHSM